MGMRMGEVKGQEPRREIEIGLSPLVGRRTAGGRLYF